MNVYYKQKRMYIQTSHRNQMSLERQQKKSLFTTTTKLSFYCTHFLLWKKYGKKGKMNRKKPQLPVFSFLFIPNSTENSNLLTHFVFTNIKVIFV